MPARVPADRRRLAPAALVLLAHGLIALWWAGHDPRPAAAPERLSWLRLLPAERPPAPTTADRPREAPVAARPRSMPAARPAPIAPPAEVARPAEPQAITLPAAPTEAASAPPLRLALPPAAPASGTPSLREQMLRDPRANSRPARAATGTLQGLGDPGPALAEETLAGEGHRRVRIGRDCYIVRESRMAQLDPQGAGARSMPAGVEPCPRP